MTRRLLITALLTTAAATAHAESTLLVIAGRVIDNQFIFGRNVNDPAVLAQRVLPAGRGLHGLSFEESEIRPDASITGALMTGNPNLTFSASASTITRSAGSWVSDGFVADQYILIAGAQNFANNLQYRQITNVTPMVLTVAETLVNEGPVAVTSVQATDAFVTTASWPYFGPSGVGPIESIKLNGGQAINHAGQDQDVADCIRIGTQHPRVRNSLIIGWRGVGIQTGFNTDALGRETNQVFGNVIESCHTGFLCGSGDIEFTGNTVLACRDYGFCGGPFPVGNVYITNCHFYGCNGETAAGVHDGICVYNPNGNGWRFVNDVMADSHFGYVSGGGNSNTITFINCAFQRNSKHNVQINAGATHHRLDACTIIVSEGSTNSDFDDVLGVEIAGYRNDISDSMIALGNFRPSGIGSGNSTATGLRISGHANSCVNTTFIDFLHPAGYSRGIHIVNDSMGNPVQGFVADVHMWGFQDSGDVFLDIDSETVKGLNITVHGNSADSDNFPETLTHANVAQYVDSPGDLDSSNVIRFVNDATGQALELNEEDPY